MWLLYHTTVAEVRLLAAKRYSVLTAVLEAAGVVLQAHAILKVEERFLLVAIRDVLVVVAGCLSSGPFDRHGKGGQVAAVWMAVPPLALLHFVMLCPHWRSGPEPAVRPGRCGEG